MVGTGDLCGNKWPSPESAEPRVEKSKNRTYLLMGKSQLVLKDSPSIGECLDFVSQRVKSIRQRMRKVNIVHAHAGG